MKGPFSPHQFLALGSAESGNAEAVLTASLGRGHVTVGQGVLPQLQSLQAFSPESPVHSYPPEDHLVMNLNSFEICPFPREKDTIFLECRDVSQIKLPLNH